MYRAYHETVVACKDSMVTGPVRQGVKDGLHASCHGCAHCRATALHLQQDCHQKGSEAAVSVTWTSQA